MADEQHLPPESDHGRIPRRVGVDPGCRSPADRLPAVVNLNET
jgi:hypothetical protein